jgi:SAM-dependent methyltransferase
MKMDTHTAFRGTGRWVREALIRARAAMIFAVPSTWRGRVAAALPARLVPPEMRPGFFQHFFDEGDPFGFDVNTVEQLKFRRTLAVCGDGPLGRVLEVGCAVGSFTELLAPRATDVLALDVSPAAVEQVTRRLRDYPNVRGQAMAIPAEFPEGTFDLVVASDVLYYLTVKDVQLCLEKIEAAVAEGGALVAVHYVPRMGSLLDGDETHDILAAHTKLKHVLGERTEFGPGRTYRVDRYEKV